MRLSVALNEQSTYLAGTLKLHDHSAPLGSSATTASPSLVAPRRGDAGLLLPPGPEGCLDGEMLDCAEQCIPAALLGNGECDEALNCDLTTWDMGDCPEPE